MNQQSQNDILRKMFPGIDEVNRLPAFSNITNPAPRPDNKMTFKELIEYKIHPCQKPDCSFYPRTTVANNQYLESELKCHGYHHAKDQRRPVVKNLLAFTGEFEYQANYFKEGKCQLSKEKYSQNFFESLYHPLYYKQFVCKRSHCDQSEYCPYYHNERERVEWEIRFEQNLKVNRQAFISNKPKQNHKNIQNNQTPLGAVPVRLGSSSSLSTDDSDSNSMGASPYRNFEFAPAQKLYFEDTLPQMNWQRNDFNFFPMNKPQKPFYPYNFTTAANAVGPVHPNTFMYRTN